MKFLYVLFSATPYKIGSFIRHMLNNRYNHVSISFDEDLSEMYSFSRRHENTPFFGGIVHESFCRFERNGISSDIKVCRIPVSDRQYEFLKTYTEKMLQQSDQYVYNYYSAAVTPLRHRIRIRNAYTCVEFVGDLLAMINFGGLKSGGFHSLPDLERKCAAYAIYEDSSRKYPGANVWTGDKFRFKMPISTGIAVTAVSFGKLTKRGVQDACRYVSDKFNSL